MRRNKYRKKSKRSRTDNLAEQLETKPCVLFLFPKQIKADQHIRTVYVYIHKRKMRCFILVELIKLFLNDNFPLLFCFNRCKVYMTM